MGRVPVLKPRQVISALEALGFVETRQRGSHKQFRHSYGRCTTVPVHGGRDISPNLLRQIAKDTSLRKNSSGYRDHRALSDPQSHEGSRPKSCLADAALTVFAAS